MAKTINVLLFNASIMPWYFETVHVSFLSTISIAHLLASTVKYIHATMYIIAATLKNCKTAMPAVCCIIEAKNNTTIEKVKISTSICDHFLWYQFS